MVNKSIVLEHIAKNTGLNIEEVNRAVNVEYWKDQIDFSSFRGYNIFGNYAKSLGIKDFEGFGNGLCMKIPKTLFDQKSPKSHVVFAYVDAIYAGLLKKEFPEFNYPQRVR